jgi:hypothetical protein
MRDQLDGDHCQDAPTIVSSMPIRPPQIIVRELDTFRAILETDRANVERLRLEAKRAKIWGPPSEASTTRRRRRRRVPTIALV